MKIGKLVRPPVVLHKDAIVLYRYDYSDHKTAKESISRYTHGMLNINSTMYRRGLYTSPTMNVVEIIK